MNLVVTILSFVFVFDAVAVQPDEACYLPMSKLSASVSKILPFAPPALPPPVTKASQTVTAISTTMNAISAVDPTQLSQASRTFLTLGVISCNDAGRPDQGALNWQDSPTQMTIGDSDLQYYFGSVAGNLLLFGGISGALALTTLKLGTEKAHFPGILILPAMFFLSPTTTSAVTLLRDGDITQQTVAGISLAASGLATGCSAIRFLPMFFHARWDDQKHEWIDASEAVNGYVARNGLLFKDYRPGYQWFILVELTMSMSVGALKSYQALQENCVSVLAAAAGVYNVYGLALIVLHPSKDRYNQIFYGTVAGLQALALATQMIASQTASEDTQQTVRTVTESIITATDYMLMAKSLFDFGRRIKDAYIHFFKVVDIKHSDSLANLFRNTLNEPMIELLPKQPIDPLLLKDSLSDSAIKLFERPLENPMHTISEHLFHASSRTSTPSTEPGDITKPSSALSVPVQHNFLFEFYRDLDRKED